MSPSPDPLQAGGKAKPPAFLSALHAAPLPPSPRRTTAQLSAVAVEAQTSLAAPSRALLSRSISSDATRDEYDDAGARAPDGGAVLEQPGPTVALDSPVIGSQTPPEGPSVLLEPTPSRPLAGSTSVHMGQGRSRSGSGTNTPSRMSMRSVASRKGKERADEASLDEVDVEGELVTVPEGSGLAAKGLRELVRRSTAGEGKLPTQTRSRATSLQGELHTLDPPDERIYTPRRYYVLTHAGKLVFSYEAKGSAPPGRPPDEAEDDLTNLMGVAQALISIFAEDDDRLRSIERGKHRIAFVLKAPLYLFCVSDWGEPEHVLRTQLEYIHLQILSVVSSTQLSSIFQRRSNFDLSRLLDGTENFLRQLIERSQSDFSFLTSTLEPLRVSPALRDTAAAALMPPSKFNDLLYVLLIAGGHIVTLLRPRKHSIHPSDLHLLLNTLASSPTLRTSETWIPMCFPKFNPAGFVHAYISAVMDDVTLVFVSADREAFEDLRAWKDIVLNVGLFSKLTLLGLAEAASPFQKLEKDKIVEKVQQAIPAHPYGISALSCPGLRHFIYKSRQLVQITSPIWEAPYSPGSPDQKRLITLYQKLHDAVHARSGQQSPLRLIYVKTEHEACLAWLTKPFELYITVSPHLTKSAVVGAANTVAKWVGVEESKVFIKDAPVF